MNGVRSNASQNKRSAESTNSIFELELKTPTNSLFADYTRLLKWCIFVSVSEGDAFVSRRAFVSEGAAKAVGFRRDSSLWAMRQHQALKRIGSALIALAICRPSAFVYRRERRNKNNVRVTEYYLSKSG